MRIVLAALFALVATGGSVGTALAVTRNRLEGDVRPVAPFVALQPSTSLFNEPGEGVGTFSLISSGPDQDFRVAPGTLAISTQTGTPTAHAADPIVLYGALPRDAESGRSLKANASEAAICATGAEPDCWMPGDAIPADVAVADALAAFVAALPPIFTSTSTTPEMQAIFGCGPYWATDCATDGIDLRVADLGTLTQSWPPFAGRPAEGPILPGSIGPPGVRDPGANALVHPFHGEALDPLAVISWNFLMLLVSQSGDGQPPIETGEFDPFAPYAIGQCSLYTPQDCASVQVFLLMATQLLDDDPGAPPARRLLWQAGALYEVTDATGDLAGYAGGTVHALGLERARDDVASFGLPLILFPSGAVLDPEAAFAVATPSAPEAPTFGLAYATAPEPSAIAVAATSVSAIAFLRWRIGRRSGARR